MTALFTLTAASVQALLPNVVADELRLDARGFGGLYAVFGAGALLGTVSRERVSARAGPLLLPGSMATFAAASIIVGSSVSPVVTGAALAVAGLCWVWTMTTLNSTIQLLAPRGIRGRIVAIYVLALAMKPVGAFLSGLLAEFVGAGTAIVTASSLALLLAMIATRVALPVLGRDTGPLDDDEDRRAQNP